MDDYRDCEHDYILRPYATLNADQILIGVYGYFNEDHIIVSLGFIIKEKVTN